MPPETAEQRIRRMELYFDTLHRAVIEAPELLDTDEALTLMLCRLTEYYDGGLWLRDYTLDEEGKLPHSLKRGVLSQDGIYDLIERIAASNPRKYTH